MTILENEPTFAPAITSGIGLTSAWPPRSGMFDSVTMLRIILADHSTRQGVVHALILTVQTWAEQQGDEAVQSGQHQQALAEMLDALHIAVPNHTAYELAGALLETSDRLSNLSRGADPYWFVDEDDYQVAVRNIGVDALRQQLQDKAWSDWQWLIKNMTVDQH